MIETLDVIIVGGGPGALQLAVRFEELMSISGEEIKYLIIEKGESIGNFFFRYPVHGKLISNNKLYTGADPKSTFSERFNWNSIITDKKEMLTRNYSSDFYPDSRI